MRSQFHSDVTLRSFPQERQQEEDQENVGVRKNKTYLNLNLPSQQQQEEQKNQTELLPILHYKYNLREIVKQIILLEDHLINQRKRCYDCIIKHFLAIEALCEEALTLNKNLTEKSPLLSLPDEIRSLQKLWYDNKETKSIETAQKLRALRKIYMEDSFDVIFNKEIGLESSCSSSKCIVK